jgi:hypothetical protein
MADANNTDLENLCIVCGDINLGHLASQPPYSLFNPEKSTGEFIHHESYEELKQSTLEGCRLCILLREGLIHSNISTSKTLEQFEEYNSEYDNEETWLPYWIEIWREINYGDDSKCFGL